MSPQAKISVDRGLVVSRVGRDVAARIELDAGLLDQALLARAEKAHRQQHQIGLELELAARRLPASPCGRRALHPFDADAFERL